jgi:hypothetical protein
MSAFPVCCVDGDSHPNIGQHFNVSIRDHIDPVGIRLNLTPPIAAELLPVVLLDLLQRF